ncbi:MAG: TIM barrel protein [Alphaproteobacteria bacterium]|nr:TIM barrel protein [Alphaproteobacteria bacterium]
MGLPYACPEEEVARQDSGGGRGSPRRRRRRAILRPHRCSRVTPGVAGRRKSGSLVRQTGRCGMTGRAGNDDGADTLARVGTLATSPDAYGVWVAEGEGDIPWPRFLDTAASGGYSMIEMGPLGYLPSDPARLRDELAKRSLGLTGGYVTGLLHDRDGRAEALEELRQVAALSAAAGARFLVLLARTTRGPQGRIALAPPEWRAMVDGVKEADRIAREEFGLTTVYHPHIGLAVETRAETERLVADTGGEIALCLDVGHFVYPGDGPVGFLRRHAEVIQYLHLRDVDRAVRDDAVATNKDFWGAVFAGLFCEPGEGILDFAGLVDVLRETGFGGPAVVERSLHAQPHEVSAATAARAYRFFRGIGFGG